MAQQITEFGRDGRPATPDGGLDSPAFHRNHQPIWAVLGKFLKGRTGDVLEAGSGTGQHVVYFARQNPGITWWPSDLSEANLKSIAAWRAGAALALEGDLRACAPGRAQGLADVASRRASSGTLPSAA